MKWLMNNNVTELWLVLLCGAATMAILTTGIVVAWRKRSAIEEGPVPRCNLEERLAQIANTPIVQGAKLASRDPAAGMAKEG